LLSDSASRDVEGLELETLGAHLVDSERLSLEAARTQRLQNLANGDEARIGSPSAITLLEPHGL
jgi:hypothetical protein